MDRYLQLLRAYLWNFDHAGRRAHLSRTGRYLFVLIRDLLEGQLTMRAMSLVYTTLLSIVPLLALAFSVLKALGAHNALQPFLLEFLSPLGEQAPALTANVIGFIEKIQVGVLGTLGIALLFWSALSLIRKVENSFNYVWRVERPRPLSQRVGEYFAVLTVGPVLVFSAMGLTASALSSGLIAQMAQIQPFGWLIVLIGKLLPYALIIALFSFAYRFVPNTRVRLVPALIGGCAAGVLWQSSSLAFGSFVAGATNYNAIYSSFAILIFLLIWLHLGWLILLIGCQLAFYVQHPEHLKPNRAPPLLSSRETEYLALMIMSLCGERFLRGESGYTQEQLAMALQAEPEHVGRVVDQLIFHKLLVESGAARTELIPARDLDNIALAELWRLARQGPAPFAVLRSERAQQVREMLDAAETDFAGRHQNQSLRQWLTRKSA